MTRELALAIRDRLKAPVILVSELGARFMFGPKQAVKLLAFIALVVLIYAGVFSMQTPVLDFLGGETHRRRPWVTSIGVFLFVPLVAYLNIASKVFLFASGISGALVILYHVIRAYLRRRKIQRTLLVERESVS